MEQISYHQRTKSMSEKHAFAVYDCAALQAFVSTVHSRRFCPIQDIKPTSFVLSTINNETTTKNYLDFLSLSYFPFCLLATIISHLKARNPRG